MSRPDYRRLFPDPSEDAHTYTRRLERDGHEEMHIRKALRAHFGMQIPEFGAFFEPHETARLRHLTLLVDCGLTGGTPERFRRKVAGNLGIAPEEADALIARFQEAGPLDFIGRTPPDQRQAPAPWLAFNTPR